MTPDEILAALKTWNKQALWGHLGESSLGEERLPAAQAAALRYMLRALSRGRIPRMETVANTLNGKQPIPDCGYIECLLTDWPHVH